MCFRKFLRCFLQSRFSIFCVISGGPQRPPRDSQGSPKKRPGTSKRSVPGSSGGLRGSQGASRDPQGAPRTPPGSPRAPQGFPGPPSGPPRALWDSPQDPQGPPRRSQGPHKDPPRTPKHPPKTFLASQAFYFVLFFVTLCSFFCKVAFQGSLSLADPNDSPGMPWGILGDPKSSPPKGPHQGLPISVFIHMHICVFMTFDMHV